METYVVQLWISGREDEPGRGDLRGFVEHVPSGRRTPFRDSDELLAFLQAEGGSQPKEVER